MILKNRIKVPREKKIISLVLFLATLSIVVFFLYLIGPEYFSLNYLIEDPKYKNGLLIIAISALLQFILFLLSKKYVTQTALIKRLQIIIIIITLLIIPIFTKSHHP